MLSDHLFVHATLKIVRPIPPQKTVRYGKYKNLDRNQFRQDLINGFSEKSPSTMDDMVQQYNYTIITALDKQISEKTKLVRDTHHQPWFDDKIKKRNHSTTKERKGLDARSVRILMEGFLQST